MGSVFCFFILLTGYKSRPAIWQRHDKVNSQISPLEWDRFHQFYSGTFYSVILLHLVILMWYRSTTDYVSGGVSYPLIWGNLRLLNPTWIADWNHTQCWKKTWAKRGDPDSSGIKSPCKNNTKLVFMMTGHAGFLIIPQSGVIHEQYFTSTFFDWAQAHTHLSFT